MDELIFIVGGMVKENDSTKYRIDATHTINTVTNEICVYPATLPAVKEGMSVVAVDRTIYGFGGYHQFSDVLMTLDMLCTFSIRVRLSAVCGYFRFSTTDSDSVLILNCFFSL